MKKSVFRIVLVMGKDEQVVIDDGIRIPGDPEPFALVLDRAYFPPVLGIEGNTANRARPTMKGLGTLESFLVIHIKPTPFRRMKKILVRDHPTPKPVRWSHAIVSSR
jgi:hypothetical protein